MKFKKGLLNTKFNIYCMGYNMVLALTFKTVTGTPMMSHSDSAQHPPHLSQPIDGIIITYLRWHQGENC